MHPRRNFGKALWLGTLVAPFVLTACSEKRTTISQTWDDRPRFFTADAGEEHSDFANVVWYERPRVFTAEPGEEHSRFMKVVYYERPRFFTKSPGEDQSRFSRMWDDRPRVFTTQTEYRTSYDTYGRRYRTYDGYRTVPVRSEFHHDHEGCDCPHKRPIKAQETTRSYTVPPSTTYTAPTTTSYTQKTTTYTPPATTTVTPTGVTRREDVYHPSAAHPRETRVELASDIVARSVDSVIAHWPTASREAAMRLQDQYGTPDQIKPDMLVWRDADPFAEITVYKIGTRHAFPGEHMDIVAHAVYMDVDADDAETFNDFQGTIKVDASKGLLTATSKSEAVNILSLNLAHDILQGEKSVDEANRLLAEKSRLIDQGDLDDEMVRSLQFSGQPLDVADEDNVDREDAMPDGD